MRFPSTIHCLLFVLLAVVAVSVQAEEPPPVRVDLGYSSKQVFRGVERAGDSAEATVALARENLRGRFALSRPFDDDEPGEATLGGAYVWRINEGLELEASVIHGWFDRVPGGGVKRSFEAGLLATLAPVGGFTPSLGYFRDLRFRADTWEIGFARSVPLTKLGAFLELNFFAGSVNGDDWRPDAVGPKRRDHYGYWGGEVELPYRVGAHTTAVAGLRYADSMGRSAANGPFGRPAQDILWFTLGITLDF